MRSVFFLLVSIGLVAACERASPPDAPMVQGEVSAGHSDVTWRWDVPPGTEHFRVRVDRAGFERLPAEQTGLTRELGLGEHAIEVQACDRDGHCSEGGHDVTMVQSFGETYPPPFRGVERSLEQTALGHVVALSCHNCYAGPRNAVLSVLDARKRIEEAVLEGADYVELDVLQIGQGLYVGHEDAVLPGARPALSELLDDELLHERDTMLQLEIKEGVDAPMVLAKALLDTLSLYRSLVRNGRPVLIKAFDDRLPYLLAIRELSKEYPFIAPYLRYYVLYNVREDEAAFEREVEAEVIANGFHGVDVAYRSKALWSMIAFARARGLGVGVWTVPGVAVGGAMLALLREQVDIITTDYAPTSARELLSAADAFTHFDASRAPDASELRARATIQPPALSQPVVLAAEGFPSFSRGAFGSPMIDGMLDFEGRAPLELPVIEPLSEGLLVSALLRFRTLELAPGETMPLVGQGAYGGAFKLELSRPQDGRPTELRFGVYKDGRWHLQAFPIDGQANAPARADCGSAIFAEQLDLEHAYLITGVSDGTDLQLLVNLRCASGTIAIEPGNPVAFSGRIVVGLSAKAPPDRALRAFDGYLQNVQVLEWTEPVSPSRAQLSAVRVFPELAP